MAFKKVVSSGKRARDRTVKVDLDKNWSSLQSKALKYERVIVNKCDQILQSRGINTSKFSDKDKVKEVIGLNNVAIHKTYPSYNLDTDRVIPSIQLSGDRKALKEEIKKSDRPAEVKGKYIAGLYAEQRLEDDLNIAIGNTLNGKKWGSLSKQLRQFDMHLDLDINNWDLLRVKGRASGWYKQLGLIADAKRNVDNFEVSTYEEDKDLIKWITLDLPANASLADYLICYIINKKYNKYQPFVISNTGQTAKLLMPTEFMQPSKFKIRNITEERITEKEIKQVSSKLEEQKLNGEGDSEEFLETKDFDTIIKEAVKVKLKDLLSTYVISYHK